MSEEQDGLRQGASGLQDLPTGIEAMHLHVHQEEIHSRGVSGHCWPGQWGFNSTEGLLRLICNGHSEYVALVTERDQLQRKVAEYEESLRGFDGQWRVHRSRMLLPVRNFH
jgi:hypothetical protein